MLAAASSTNLQRTVFQRNTSVLQALCPSPENPFQTYFRMCTLSNKPVFDFIHTVATLSLDPLHLRRHDKFEEAVRSALQFEELIRRHFAGGALTDPFIGLINIFDTPSSFRRSFPRTINSAEDFDAHHLFPLSDENRRTYGSPCAVKDVATFKHNWRLFSHGVLEQLQNWDHIVVAGGSVLAALVQPKARTDNELLKLYHSDAFSLADIDLFLWGLSPHEAEGKICDIFDAVKASVPWDVVAVRKANVISIHTQFPHRHIQIILRLYQSPAEILVGFDVDCSSVCFDGEHVWATPRAMASIISERNVIDMTRRSPSYEMRLFKYAQRGFEIWYPHLRRKDVDVNLYDPELMRIPTGLARLIVLEELLLGETYLHIRFCHGKLFISAPRTDNICSMEEVDAAGFNSNYDYTPHQIPYALEWDAEKVRGFAKRIEQKISSSYNPTNRGHYLHRHVMLAFDNIQDCFANFCIECPLPRNRDEEQLQKKNDARYIRGHLQFMTDNPGQQLISGSFHPINDNEWEVGAYGQ